MRKDSEILIEAIYNLTISAGEYGKLIGQQTVIESDNNKLKYKDEKTFKIELANAKNKTDLNYTKVLNMIR